MLAKNGLGYLQYPVLSYCLSSPPLFETGKAKLYFLRSTPIKLKLCEP